MSICLIPISNTEPVSVNTSHGQTTKYWGTQIILWPHHFLPELEHSSLFWARVSAFAYMYVTTNIHTGLKLPLNAAGLWMRHEDLLEWRACTTHSALRSVSLAASALNHLSSVELLHPQCLLCFAVLQFHLVDPSQQLKNESCSLYTLNKAHSYKAR